jgi:putative DNA primase/helicase
VRKGLAPLVEFGEKTGASVVGISHFTKSTQGKEPIERIVGSIAFGAVARVVFAAATLPENDAEGGSRLFCRVKSNIGPDSGGFKYDLAIAPLFEYPEIAASSVVWGSQVEGSAKDLLSGEDGNKEDENLSPCAEWLKELLTYGAKSKQEIDDAAREIGWTTKQVLTAKTKLRVESRKRGFSEGWFWSLREGTFKNE